MRRARPTFRRDLPSRLSFQIMGSVRRRFFLSTSEARAREPTGRPNRLECSRRPHAMLDHLHGMRRPDRGWCWAYRLRSAAPKQVRNDRLGRILLRLSAKYFSISTRAALYSARAVGRLIIERSPIDPIRIRRECRQTLPNPSESIRNVSTTRPDIVSSDVEMGSGCRR